MVLTIKSGGHWPDDAERIIRDLPEWFGMADANAAYVEAARVLPTFVARRGDKILGVCSPQPSGTDASLTPTLGLGRRRA